RTLSRGPAPPTDRSHRRSRAHARRARPHTPHSRVKDCPRTGSRGDCDSTPQDEGGARCARSGRRAAHHARIPALTAEVESAFRVLKTPASRLITRGKERLLLLKEVEALLPSKAFVVDACRHVVRRASKVVSPTRRPVLFALLRALGEAWPGDVPRDMLVARAFGAKRVNESHRVRLRVEVGRFAGCFGRWRAS